MTLPELQKAIRTVIDYNWRDELLDYCDNCGDTPDQNQRKGHIFETLVELANFVDDTRHTARNHTAAAKKTRKGGRR